MRKLLFIIVCFIFLISTFQITYAEASPKLKYKIESVEGEGWIRSELINDGENLLVVTKVANEEVYIHSIYDVKTGEKISKTKFDGKGSTSSSGNYLSISTYSALVNGLIPLNASKQKITVYRLPDFKVVMQHKWMEDKKRYHTYRFSQDEKYMYMLQTFTSDKEHSILIDAYNLETGEMETLVDYDFDRIMKESGYKEGRIDTLIVSPDRQKLFLIHDGFMIYVRDFETSELLYKIDTSKGWNTPGADVRIYPEKDLVVIKVPIETDFFRYSTGEKITKAYKPKPIGKNSYPIYNFSLTNNLQTLITTSTYGNVETWDIVNGTTLLHRQEKGFMTVGHQVINKHTLFYNMSDRNTWDMAYYRILDVKENKILLTVEAKNEFTYISEVTEQVMVSVNEDTVYVWDISPFVRQILKVYINKELLDTESLIINGRTMVPLRMASEYLGFKVSWDHNNEEIKLIKDDNSIKLKINSNEVSVNDEKVFIDTEPIIKDGTTYVPIRFFANVSGAEVYWDQENKSVHIFKQ